MQCLPLRPSSLLLALPFRGPGKRKQLQVKKNLKKKEEAEEEEVQILLLFGDKRGFGSGAYERIVQILCTYCNASRVLQELHRAPTTLDDPAPHPSRFFYDNS
jgi:hypothetical protein